MDQDSIGRDLMSALRELHADADSTGFDEGDALHAWGDPVHCLMYAQLLWPEFVVVDGHVFLRFFAPEPPAPGSVPARGTEEPGALAGYNWIEVGYLFASRAGSDEMGRVLANVLREIWSAKLLRDFPDREFSVRVLEPEQTGSVVGVGFEEVNAGQGRSV